MDFVLIYGKKIRSVDRGWTALECPHCEIVQPFRVTSGYQTDSLYFIEVSETQTSEVITCEFCESSFAIGTDVTVETDAFWTLDQDFQDLVDKTAPDLGTVTRPDGRTDAELIALLQSIGQRTSLIGTDSTAGIIAGGILGPLIAVPLGLLLNALGVQITKADLFGRVFLYIIAGVLLGTVIGSVMYVKLSGRWKMRDMLRRAVKRHRLKLDDLWRLAREQPGLAKLLPILEAERNA